MIAANAEMSAVGRPSARSATAFGIAGALAATLTTADGIEKDFATADDNGNGSMSHANAIALLSLTDQDNGNATTTTIRISNRNRAAIRITENPIAV